MEVDLEKNDMELVDNIYYWCEEYKNGEVNLLEFTFKVSKIITKLQSKFLQHKI